MNHSKKISLQPGKLPTVYRCKTKISTSVELTLAIQNRRSLVGTSCQSKKITSRLRFLVGGDHYYQPLKVGEAQTRTNCIALTLLPALSFVN